ncbi:MAG: amidohydrolase family protein [Rhodospirillales bacterium]|nr:amidohydrolase family protein [Rhodospirillales bacterium]
MFDLLIRNARTADGDAVDIGCVDGRIVALAANLQAEAGREIDAGACLVTPPFVDSHFHMDATLSFGQPRINASGTLLEGIQIWSELKPDLTVAAIKERALECCKWAIARGTLAIRSHVDICDPRLLAVDALLEVREEIAPYIDLQLVAFPQDGYLRTADVDQQLKRALDKGVDVVGGIPHFERTMADGAKSVRALMEIAAARGLMVDMHCDETDDPLSRHIETLSAECHRLRLHGRVAGSHLTSMHSMDNYYVSKLLPLMRDSGVAAIANPLINITLQGRHDTYPKRRGLTRIREIIEMGIPLALGHDCVMDPWYSFGSYDMLEVAHMAVHAAQMTSMAEIRKMFDAVTVDAAKILNLQDYGLHVGARADLVILQAQSPFDAIRLRPNRLFVIRRGQVIAETPRTQAHLNLDGTRHSVDFTLKNQG